MSKIFEIENQFIIRFPKEIADKIHKSIDEQKEDDLNLEIQPYYENINNKCEELKFNINLDNQNLKGCLVNMPCIVESQKSLDGINFYKSNDINQMILVEENDNGLLQKFYQQRITSCENPLIMKKKIKKNDLPSGLTAPTKFIKQRYFRKKLNIIPQEIDRVEKKMISIISDFTKQRDQSQQSIQKRKRRYRRHL